MASRTTRRRHSEAPRIEIGRTVTNDLRLMLDMLAPTRQVARLIQEYDTILADHQAELLLVSQVVNRSNGHHPTAGDEGIDPTEAERDQAEGHRRSVAWLAEGGSLLR